MSAQHIVFLVLAALVMLGGAGPAHAADEASGWRVVWADEFDGDALDRTKWSPEEACWGGGNNERQCYTDRAANIRVENGMLRLIAKRERFTGPMYPDALEHLGAERKFRWYTSGKVRTRGLAAWKYGRISARMKLPAGQGTWPAFWMMPEADLYGPWPLSGELDIMEAVNLETLCADCPGGVERRTSGAVHFGAPQPENTYLFGKTVGADTPGPSEEWRVYSVEWAEGVIQWFVDDQIFLRVTSDQWFTTSPQAEGRPYAPFDQPFHVMFNLAVGGNLAEKSNKGGFDPKSFPSELLVDWVRVEQCADDVTGRSCLSKQDWSGKPQGPWETMAR
jgi:beta-glucanase (GH16 family)